MKIVVFGASRGVGLEVVKQALEAGHAVTAFVRSPEKFTVKDANLTVFKGDSMDAESVEKAIAGHEAVISALGPTRPAVPHMMETSAKNIVAGMKKHSVRRLVSTTGAGVRQPEDQPKFIDHFIGFLLNLLAKDVVLDSAANVKVIRESDLDWTVVRFPRLVDGERKGGYQVGYVSKSSGTQLSRADGADYILKELTEMKWLKKLPLVSY
ncbi:MAG TPA: NmrA family transcriptional regulator [Anaerolineae bacterium]|nr:NmrA family transcriptional regulator [Anaerolineae bacterium]HRJ58482.1 SDR family oxidoreductase [Anaerolineales bacterium]